MRRKLLVLPVLVAGMVGLSHGQPPGGGFPGGGGFGGKGGEGRMRFGGGGADPEVIWGFVSKGQPYLDLNDPANARTKDRMMKEGTPIPADGKLTKELFTANFKAAMEKRAAAGGATPGAPMTFQMGGPPGSTPGAFPGGDRGDRGGRGPGGFDPSAMTDDQLKMMMRRYDTDGDGRISAAEGAQSDRIRDVFAQYDTNRDGFIDTTEYRVYMTARTQQQQAERGQSQMPGGPMPAPGAPSPFTPPAPGQPNPATPGQPGTDEPTRPEVFRYGKLPKGAPSWMLAPSSSNSAGLDADRDGQVGLYEWRRAGKKTSEFVDMDLNGDGYLTYVEWKTYNERLAEKQKAEDPDAPAPIVITPGGSSERGPKGGREERGSKGEKGDRGAKGDRKAGRNPFANGSKGN